MPNLTNVQKLFPILLFCFFALGVRAQEAVLSGMVADSLGQPIPYTSVAIQGTTIGVASNLDGRFSLRVPAGKDLKVLVSHVEYLDRIYAVNLTAGERKHLQVVLQRKVQALEGVEIQSNAEYESVVRDEAGAVSLKPKTILGNVSAFGDFSQALAGQLGVVGNNELSSSYTVRGGSFDENLVYVNGIEIYRPFLIRSGEQEGLSFVNPDLVGNISFFAGGWQPKLGDKLSSVLDITYKRPERNSASATAGLLGGRVHWEGFSKNGRFSQLAGIRYKSSRYLLNTLDVNGAYLPRFADGQVLLSWDLAKERGRSVLSVLGSYAANRYEVVPQSRQTNFGTLQQAFRLYVAFEGTELMRYDTWQGGINFKRRFSDRFTSWLIVSGVRSREREYRDLEGGYRLCDVDKNTASSTFNECVLTRGLGTLYNYSRNQLDVTAFSVENKHEFHAGDGVNLAFGIKATHRNIEDVINEYAFTDSADYVTITERLQAPNALETTEVSAYLQNTQYIGDDKTLTYGIRAFLWSPLKGAWLSPRIQYSARPAWSKNLVMRWSAGLYQQAPFYRELRDFEGVLNTNVRPQSSAHLIAGFDKGLKIWGRPFQLIGEAYYKWLWNVVAYDIDNVRLRYYARNDATARIAGADIRLSGEFIPGAESWFNLSLLSATEDLAWDERGNVRRPSDQRVTVGVFFQDHLPWNPTWKANVKLLYGSGLPYGPPNSLNQRATLNGGSKYNRVDIGFSKLLLLNSKDIVNDKRALESVWIGLDILNLVGTANNISFTWINDLYGNQYAVPNSLSQRFFNLRIVVKY